MKRCANKHGFSFSLGILLLLSACGKLVDVDVTVVDKKTALENQVLGSYEELGKETILLASVRSVDENGKLQSVAEIPPGKLKAVRALQRVEFNRDDILRFKKLGCAGEGNAGYMQFFECEETRNDPESKEFIQAIIKEENQDRLAILERIIATNVNFSKGDLSKVQKIYAKLNKDNSEPGVKIQTEDGRWITK